MPDDVFEITAEQHSELMEGQSSGKVIAYKSRKIQLVDADTIKKTWEEIRDRRDRLLANCDWTQMADSPLSDTMLKAWRTYRQKLRDITSTYSDPNKVVWPLAPTEA